MARRVIDFSEKAAGKILVPLSHVVSLEEKTTFDEAASQLKGKWFSRIPVYREEVYNIVGILYGFDLLKIPAGIKRRTGRQVYERAFFRAGIKEGPRPAA